jgi:hypothetical protein
MALIQRARSTTVLGRTSLTAISIAATAIASLVGCGTPGYRVHVEARPVSPSTANDTLAVLGRYANESGFSTVRDKYEGVPKGTFVWVYQKRLSNESGDWIEIVLEHFSGNDRIVVFVENRVRGMDAPVKAEIEAVGDFCASELSAVAGSEHVSVSRERTRISREFP